ncbi:TPA: hypothetical protein DCR79_00780 [Patescibacteria group bacterium]|uniref:Uncharacterized protein n=2 Tax=Bacteria division Kazan-3B-28 TaxID=1798534 RepID=A0A0G1NS44_UNCK3|nr:MAG: hypothetical protein VE96_C0009G0006 [candidate division Kazan bacterium GW2011_GWA1_44_22]KKT87019.1 MAG: hypothetical protein VE97_C0008G0004 [candidate division Kazan bacterium GW2011_GWB1_45_10]HAR54816.1 hypothetical protein [Patescibacteria group bacterium]HCR42191.1 hypothetical protein [Patescibacteria group bacterium]
MDDGGAAINVLIERIKNISIDVLENYILPVAGALVVILIIWSGIKYITGGPKGEEAAKKSLIAIFIGVIIMMIAVVVVNLIKNIA